MYGVFFPLTFIDSITWVERGKADAEPIYEGKHTTWVTALVTHVWLFDISVYIASDSLEVID